MKITIDTKEDSHDEIKRLIKMLSSFVGEQVMTNQGNIFEDKEPTVGNQNVFGMFDNNTQNSTAEEDKVEKTEENKEKEDIDLDIPGLDEY